MLFINNDSNKTKCYFNTKKITHFQCINISKVIYIWFGDALAKPLVCRFKDPEEYQKFKEQLLQESELM